MDKLMRMHAFAQVIAHGGFAAAAREMGLSRSAVSKYVQDLEREVGAQLLRRTTRVVSPTEIGGAYYERAKSILADVAEADEAVSQLHSEPRGLLRVNAPMSFGTLHLGQAIADFMRANRTVSVQLALNDRFVDPIEEGHDVTIQDCPVAGLQSHRAQNRAGPNGAVRVARLLQGAEGAEDAAGPQIP